MNTDPHPLFGEAESDAFTTIPGLNSLYFWTGQDPPTYYNSTEIVWANEQEQAEILAALRKFRRPRIVINDAPAIAVNGSGSPYAYPERSITCRHKRAWPRS